MSIVNIIFILSILVSVVGNGTIIIQAPPGYQYYIVSYRIPGDNEWIPAINTTNSTIELKLPYGKYVLMVQAINNTDNKTFYAVVDNKPKYLDSNAIIMLGVLAITAIASVLTGSILLFILSLPLLLIYDMEYLGVFSPVGQALIFITYMLGVGGVVIWRRR